MEKNGFEKNKPIALASLGSTPALQVREGIACARVDLQVSVE